jgi:hypothetical protein
MAKSLGQVTMKRTLQAGIVCFAIILGAGFIPGVVRVPLLVPRIGELRAELAEMPIMAVVTIRSAAFGVMDPKQPLSGEYFRPECVRWAKRVAQSPPGQERSTVLA